MHQHYPLERKRPFFSKVQQIAEEDDDEQVKKTLNFFDAILDEYLHEPDQRLSHSATNLSQMKSHAAPANKHLLHPMDAVQPRFSTGETRVPYVRRYTSENNLNQLHVPSRPAMLQKSHRHSLLQTTATSTDDLHQRSSVKNSSSQTNLSSSMGISASLIDLSTINQVSARPLFRFVPPSTNIVKPTVITPTAIPSLPSSAPISRFAENGFHHENGVSAFKPLASTRVQPPAPAAVKTEFLYPPSGVHVGLSNQSSVPGPLLRQSQTGKPYYHQSMFDLTSNGTPPAPVSNVSHHPHYIRQSNHPPRPTRYYPPSSRSPPSLLTEPVTKFIQQMKSSSSMYPSVTRPSDYSTPSYSTTNGFDRSHLRPNYVSHASAGNIYHFDAKSSHQNGSSSKSRTSKSNPHGHEFILTTYL